MNKITAILLVICGLGLLFINELELSTTGNRILVIVTMVLLLFLVFRVIKKPTQKK